MRANALPFAKVLTPFRNPKNIIAIDASRQPEPACISQWSASAAKRRFDLVCVVLTLPLTLPILLLTALAVRLTSRGPVLFRQRRMGCHGRAFVIFKFRTMHVRTSADRGTITTLLNQPFTPVGPFLRHWKLDELPQVFNVLRGDMSLVGPRPRIPRSEPSPLPCRPGITGRATLVFAQEESALTRVREADLDFYYDSVILPMKRRLDADYMSEATFRSDLGMIVRSLFRRWEECEAENSLPLIESELLPG